jgi:copper chaperone CopZ
MASVTLRVPGMYGDHHVIAVRRALLGLEGVSSVTASAMSKQVRVEYDPAKQDAPAITAALEQAGYPVGEPEEAVAAKGKRDPSWQTLGAREVQTNPLDKQMSGDFRKY